MGAYVSYLWWGGQDPDAEDPVSGLSKRDIHLIRASWVKVTADSVGSGSELLIRFFKAYPDNMQFFRTFKTMGLEELRENKQFQAHSLSIISSLSDIIDNLEKPELAAVMCAKLGSTHGQRNISEKEFDELKDTLVKLFLDLQFDEVTMVSWVKTVTFIYGHIFKQLKGK